MKIHRRESDGEEIKMVNYKQLNGLTLAYLGDAVYELHVREYLVNTGQVKPNELHQQAVRFVSATSQATIIRQWLDAELLTEEEERIFARGRNAKSRSIPKSTSVQAYRYSTGLEALIGYLYVMDQEDRLLELLNLAIQIIEQRSREDE